MKYSPLIQDLVRALTALPGVGPKSAQRMTLQLLERDREGGRRLAAALRAAMDNVKHCLRCRNFTEQPLCAVCADSRRDQSLLCIVETPADMLALEQSGGYRGLYFVLMGRLSPLDGVGADELALDLLWRRLAEEPISEVILATSATIEGEATSHFIAEGLRPDISVTRIAQGVPLGGELEYVDAGTLARALSGRKQFERF